MAGENDVRFLYQQLLNSWNRRAASDFAALFAHDGGLIGFDGTVVSAGEIQSHLSGIFTHHQTAAYVGKVQEVRLLTQDTALLRAIAGMVPPGQADLNPAVNAIQSLVAVRRSGRWQIAQFQNTPAAFHGRPELVERMTAELRQMLGEPKA